jgi:hypothetical protein
VLWRLPAASAAAAAPGPLPPEDDKELRRAILQELVEINTTHAVGSTVAAHAIEQHLLKAERDIIVAFTAAKLQV